MVNFGALTIAGLGMRFVSLPMIINMAVAVLSVKLKEVSSLSDFANLDEPLYALTYTRHLGFRLREPMRRSMRLRIVDEVPERLTIDHRTNVLYSTVVL